MLSLFIKRKEGGFLWKRESGWFCYEFSCIYNLMFKEKENTIINLFIDFLKVIKS